MDARLSWGEWKDVLESGVTGCGVVAAGGRAAAGVVAVEVAAAEPGYEPGVEDRI